MYSTYCSSVVSLRSKGPFSFSLNDYRCFSNERIDQSAYPSCTCCVSSIHGVPIYPRILNGLRQSSLIHCSASRRLILVGFDRYCRLPTCVLDRDCYGVSCSLEENRVCSKRRGDGRIGCMGGEDEIEISDSGVDGIAEAMLSLMTEQLSEKFVGRSSARCDLVEKRQSVVDERSWKDKECVRAKSLERENIHHSSGSGQVIDERSRNNNKFVQAKLPDRNSKGAYGSITVESKKKFHRQPGSGRVAHGGPKKEKEWVQANSSDRNSKDAYGSVTVENFHHQSGSGRSETSSRTDNGGLRRENSGYSSYYSASATGDIERDTDVQVKHAQFVGESSSGYSEKQSRSSREAVLGVDVREQFKSYNEDVDRYREISTQRNDAGSAVRSDAMRKGYERKLRSKAANKITEVSVGTLESREESSWEFTKREVKGSSTEMVASHEEQLSGREDGSTVAVNLVAGTTESNRQSGLVVDKHTESRRKSQQFQNVSEIHSSDLQRASSSRKRFNGKKGDLTSAVHLVQEAREDHRQIVDESIEKTNLRRESQQLTEVSKDSNIDVAYAPQTSFETEMNIQQENSTSYRSSTQKSDGPRSPIYQGVNWKTKLRRGSQHRTNMSEMTIGATETATAAQTLSETRMNGRERNSASLMVDLAHEGRQEGRLSGEGIIEQVGLRRESPRPTKASSFPRSTMERASSSKTPFHSIPQARVQHVGVQTEDDRNSEIMLTSLSSQFTRTDETFEEDSNFVLHEDTLDSGIRFERSSSQFVGEFVQKVQDEMLTSEIQKEQTSSQSPSLLVSEGLQMNRPGSRQSSDVSGSKVEMWGVVDPSLQGSSSRGEPEEGISMSGSAIAKRTGKSFWGIIADVARMRRATPSETSNSALKSGRRSSSNVSFNSEAWFSGHEPNENDENDDEDVKKQQRGIQKEIQEEQTSAQQNPSPLVSEGLQMKRPSPRQSSDVSGSQGEMWGVVDPSLQGSSSRGEPEEGISTARSAIARRTGRSFWGIIADVARMRRGTPSETSNSALKSGRRTSSNVSFNSEAWLSGHEPKENDDEDVKKRHRGIQKEQISVDQPEQDEAPSQSQTEVSEAKISEDRLSNPDANTLSYSGELGRGITDQGSSLASLKEKSGWRGSDQGAPSSIAPVDSSFPLPTRSFIRSPVMEQMPESSKVDVSRSDVEEHMEQSTGEKLTEVHGTDRKDGELKRKKLQRNKQVPKDRFVEWEKAYKLETEQRKVDIMFMREALLEAQRAADIWEVPVGAVLVQNGEIIARGCNLVEELRDSTAHAEMICIKEASNLLKTWRLSGTTLYVTLEPCPMCAGAILQARIDTVVWGAPNKLLGADGSWIRLFHSEGDGGSSSDPTSQPAGPIHPFHPKITIRRRVLETECAEVMQQFFHLRRMKKEKKSEPEPHPPCLPVSTHPSKFFSRVTHIFSIMLGL